MTLQTEFRAHTASPKDGWIARAREHIANATWSWVAFVQGTGVALLVVLATAVLWLYFLDWNTMRGPVARYASHRIGREVRIAGDLKVHLFSWTPRVSVSGVQVVNPAWVDTPLAADVGHLAFSFRLWPFITGRLVLPFVQIDNANVLVVRDIQRRTNWDFGNSNKGWKLPPINNFIVQNGKLAIDDRLRKMTFIGTISSHERADGGNSAFLLTGTGTLNGRQFAAEFHGGPLINVDESKPYHFAADIHSGRTHATADGVVDRPFHLGQFTAATTFSGPNLSELYYLTGLVLPGTPPYRISGELVRDGATYRFTQFAGVVGGTDLRGDLSVDTSGQIPFVHAALASRKLNFDDLGPLVGAPSRGTNSPSPAVTSHYLLPDRPLHVERLRQMNADVQYDAATVKSQDFPLHDFHVHVALDNGLLALNPVTFNFTHGKLAGTLKLDARGATPQTTIDARLSDIRLEQFVTGNPPPVEGLFEAHARLQGAGNSVHKAASTASGAVTLVMPGGKFRQSFAELTGINLINGLGLLLANDKSDTGLRCAVAHFDARNGLFNTQQFVFDTDPVLIEGQGNINLADETLNMTVSGKSKKFRLGRLRAPITLTGPFSHPSIGIKAGPALAQGGIATALGFLSPIAALLPFVDPGLAKNADCVALSAEASQATAPVRSKPMPGSAH